MIVPPNDIGSRCIEIQDLIAGDNVCQATKRLMDFVRDFSSQKEHLQEVIVISATYNRLDKYERRNTLSFNDLEVKRNQLLFQILDLLDEVQKQLLAQIGIA